MTTFQNQTVGSFDDQSHEYVEIWFDETQVKGFAFHSVMQRDVIGASHRLFGIEVEARFVFAACDAFNCITNIQGVAPREHLRMAQASNSADYVARALKSAEGAERHARNLEARQ